MSGSPNDLLNLLAAFSNGLSHTLRTPLSVISNDLSYLETLVEPEELERSKRRCQDISQMLQELHLSNTQNTQPLAIQDLTGLLERQGAAIHAPLEGNVSSRGNSMVHALTLLDTFLKELCEERHYTFFLSENVFSLTVTFQLEEQTTSGAFSGLTAFLQSRIGINSYVPPFVEIILSANAASTSLSADTEGVSYTIKMPVHAQ